MVSGLTALAAVPVAIWLYLLFARGGFWRTRERLDGEPAPRPAWPAVTAIVPARDEVEVIGASLAPLLTQDYPGPFAVVLVDDHSADGTAAAAERIAREVGRPDRLSVVAARPLPLGWSGKPWALAEGAAAVDALAPDARYLWLTDADVVHDPANLRRLVAEAEDGDRDLVSLMVLLSTCGLWERLLVPAFVFFFCKLYPFARVADPTRRTAAAAGGCVLLRRTTLAQAGGLASIRDALIDDCALARRIRDGGRPGGGRLRLRLTRSARSVRPYGGLAGVWRMVARTAYTQLRHSPVLLAGTAAGMTVTYLLPPLLALTWLWHGDGAAAALGLCAWALMVVAFRPTLRLYREPAAAVVAPLLPLTALLYLGMTLDSARRHRQGRGGAWKGRVQAPPRGPLRARARPRVWPPASFSLADGVLPDRLNPAEEAARVQTEEAG